MDVCIALQIYFQMANAHMDTAVNHVKIAEGGQFLQRQCEDLKKVTEKKGSKKASLGESKLELKDK